MTSGVRWEPVGALRRRRWLDHRGDKLRGDPAWSRRHRARRAGSTLPVKFLQANCNRVECDPQKMLGLTDGLGVVSGRRGRRMQASDLPGRMVDLLFFRIKHLHDQRFARLQQIVHFESNGVRAEIELVGLG